MNATVDVNKDERDFMLTTKDNPFNPWTQYDDWYAYDRDKGYNSPSYQARIAVTSDDLSDEENDLIINDAIEEIIRIDQQYGFNVGYTKAYKP
jgi:hypothetical protein